MLSAGSFDSPLGLKPSTAVGTLRSPPQVDGTVNFRGNLEGIKDRVSDLAIKCEDTSIC